MKNVPDRNAQKLMTDGLVCLGNPHGPARKVSRGMPVIAQDGCEVGQVAAVVFDGSSRQVTHLLLGRLPELHGYWLIALDQISRVEDEAVLLAITAGAATALPAWRAAPP